MDTLLQVVMYAQLRGNSQSLVKVVSGGLPYDVCCQPPVIEHETSVSASKSFGMIVMDAAVSTAMDKAAASGIAVVGTHGTASGTGALGCCRGAACPYSLSRLHSLHSSSCSAARHRKLEPFLQHPRRCTSYFDMST